MGSSREDVVTFLRGEGFATVQKKRGKEKRERKNQKYE
jgi:hypothetical protein